MKLKLYITITVIAVFLMCGMEFITCQSPKGSEIKLYFREDWKEIPAETPVTQEHVSNPELILKRHGPGEDKIRKSHHEKPADDPWYVWSGQCEGHWALTLHKEKSLVNLSNGGNIRWRTKQFGGRVLHVVIGTENGDWYVSDQGSGETSDWYIFNVDLDTLHWRRLNIEEVIAGEPISDVALNRIKYVGCTDLMSGGGSKECSRLDWIEVYGRDKIKF